MPSRCWRAAAVGADKTLIDLKLSAADLFTTHLDTSAELAAYDAAAIPAARAYLSAVLTSLPTAAQVDAAIAGIVTAHGSGPGTGTGGVPGQTFTLTGGTDNFLPTATDAAFKTTLNDDIFRWYERQGHDGFWADGQHHREHGRRLHGCDGH